MKEDLNEYIGQKFHDWLVIGVGKPKPYTNTGRRYYKKTLTCECRCRVCNKITRDVTLYALLHDETTGCGKKYKVKHNQYDLNNEYGIGYTTKGEEFYFDLEDYDLIKDYCWFYNGQGYPIARDRKAKYGTKILLHNLVMNAEPCTLDHANRIRHDCRKENLRSMTRSQNASNINIRKDNTSGFIGVYWDKESNKWLAMLQYEKETYRMGLFEDKNDAIKARLKAEKELMGEFAPQRHLFEQYEI